MGYNPLVRKLSAVARLTREDERQLEALCRHVHEVPARQEIIREGERPRTVYLMIEGWAARHKMLPDGTRQILAFLLPGDLCDPHVTILAEMDHGILALTRCVVARVSSRAIDAVTERNAPLARALWWTTLVDDGVLRAWIVNNGRRDSQARIAHLFCELHARMKAIGLVEDGRFDLPLTQEEIADATSMTPVHANRTLQRLRAEGLIELRKRELTVLNAEGLAQVAGFNPNYLHLKPR